MKNFFKRYQSLIIFCILIVIPLFAMLPLFHSGFFPMHDDEQVGRLVELAKVVSQGQIPPRWVPDLGFGYGYPLFNFYPPLFYYVGELFSFLGVGFVLSTKIALIIGFICSSISMYLWIQNRFGKMAGIFAAIVYTYVPYHAIDIYVRGAFSEFFSFIFIPAVFWAMDKVSTSRQKLWIVMLSVLLTCVVLAHNLVALQAVPFILLYSVYLLRENRKDFLRLLISFSLAGIGALGLSAYFWLPALAEKQFTLVDSILTKELANYAIHFVYPIQLWSSPWGYGGSTAGMADGLSFQLGKLDILLAGSSIFLLFVKKQKNRAFGLFLFALFAFSVFLTTDYSRFIWDHFSPFWYIQFPWRFLLLVGVFSAALGGYVFSMLERFLPKRFIFIALIILSGLFIFQVHRDFKPQKYLLLHDNHYMQNIQWDVSRMSYEYVPKQVATQKTSLGTTELAINKNELPVQTYQVLSGKMHIEELINISQEKRYLVSISEPGLLQINTYSFPGWIVIVNGQKVSYNDTNRLHLIQIPLDMGKYIVEVKLINTLPRALGNTISLISLLGILSLVGILIKKNYEKANS